MATTKKEAAKTTTVKAAAKKVETKPVAETKKAEVKPAAETKKVETKTTVKKTTAKKTEPKKTAAKTTTAKKTTAKKTAAKKTAVKKENNLYVQFGGMEFDAKNIEEAVKADYKAKNGKRTMTSVSIYVKPEDMKAYYVIDGIIGDIAL